MKKISRSGFLKLAAAARKARSMTLPVAPPAIAPMRSRAWSGILRATTKSTTTIVTATAEMIATGQDGPAGVAVFGDYVYFTASGASTVNRVRKTGGAVEVIAKNQIGARAVVADESGVYFSRDTGEIVRLAP